MPRGKKNAIEQHINQKYSNGVEITISQLAEEIGCTVQNVYIYVRKNPSRFTKVRRGLYQVNPHSSTSNGSSHEESSLNSNLTFGTITE
jgi:hypothetical protein